MLKRMLLVAGLMVALASPALAETNGVYVGLKFLDSIQSTGSVSKSSGISSLFDVDNYTQNTVGGGIYVGYDFYPQNQVPVRTEIEYAIRTNSTTTWDLNDTAKVAADSIAKSGGADTADASLKGEWNLQTLFLNAYWDFHNDTAFTPYIGGGIGLGFLRTKYELEVAASAHGQTASISDSFSETHTVFAWNAGAGCSYAFNENFSADLAYRFVGLSYSETEKTLLGSKGKIGMAPYANEFSLGLRYTF